MKKRNLSKKLLAVTLGIVLAISLTACDGKNEGASSQGNSSSENVNNEVSLSGTPSTLFNSDERRLWYRTRHEIAKDTQADLFVFENGKVTCYYSDRSIKLGDLDGKSDDEIIAMYEATAENIEKADSFSFHIYTDNTGNNTEYERLRINFDGYPSNSIEYPCEHEFYYVTTTAYQIYSTNYAAFTDKGSKSLFYSFLTKVDGAFDISLDQPGANGVEVD